MKDQFVAPISFSQRTACHERPCPTPTKINMYFFIIHLQPLSENYKQKVEN